jgi:hypothetical protein
VLFHISLTMPSPRAVSRRAIPPPPADLVEHLDGPADLLAWSL